MPRKKLRKRKAEEQHTHLAIRVERYEAHISASINHNVYGPQYAWNLDEDDPLYEFTAQLTISGISTYPEGRAGESYEVTIYGDDAPSRGLSTTLKDVQARNKYGAPQYRQYRHKEVPVYEPPRGLGLLDKVRGERRWTAWLFVTCRLVDEMIVLLGQERPLYIAIHEWKEVRTRWIRGLTLQTVDPAQE